MVRIPVYSQRQSFQFGNFLQIRPQRESRQSFPYPRFPDAKVFPLQGFPAPRFSVSKVFRHQGFPLQGFPAPKFSVSKVFQDKIHGHPHGYTAIHTATRPATRPCTRPHGLHTARTRPATRLHGCHTACHTATDDSVWILFSQVNLPGPASAQLWPGRNTREGPGDDKIWESSQWQSNKQAL